MVEAEPMLEVVSPGIQSLIQDLGRIGFASVAVAQSGAHDSQALIRANEAVGNPGDLPGIECLLGGLELRALRETRLAWVLPYETSAEQVELRRGETLTIPRLMRGLRAYATVPGGIRTESVLGSSSTDTMSGLGPAPLVTGHVLRGSTDVPHVVSALPAEGTVLPGSADAGSASSDTPEAIEVVVSPGHGPFRPDAIRTLETGVWSVSPMSSRVGMRLSGPGFGLTTGADLRSQPVMRGTIQSPADGELIILGPEGPATGGYPAVGVVADRDLSRLAQLRPGEPISLTVRHNTAVSS